MHPHDDPDDARSRELEEVFGYYIPGQPKAQAPRLRLLDPPKPEPPAPNVRERRRRLLAHLLTEPETVAEALEGLDLSEEPDPARAVARRLLRRLCWDYRLWRDDFDLDRLHRAVKAWARSQGEDGELVAARFKTAWESTLLPEDVNITAYAVRLARCKPTGVMDDFTVEDAPALTRVCRRLADATAYLEAMLRGVKGPKADRLPGWPLNDKPTADLFHTNTKYFASALGELVDRGVLKVAMGWQRGGQGQPGRRRRFTAKRHREAEWFKDCHD